MGCKCEHCATERGRLEWIIEQQARLLRSEFDLISTLLERKGLAVKARMVLDEMQNAKLATFTEQDASGNPVKPSGPITFASDNPGVAMIDSTQQQLSADGFSVTCPVVSVPGATGTANITGVDSASPNKVAAGDVDTVAIVPVATQAKLVLS